MLEAWPKQRPGMEEVDVEPEEDTEGRRLIWRTLLWDGASDELVDTLARERVKSLAHIDASSIARWAFAGVLESLEDALELARLAHAAQLNAGRIRMTKAMQGSLPRLRFSATAGTVQVHVREDLHGLRWFEITPHEAGDYASRLLDEAREAIKLGMGQSGDGETG
jgi:hypothetical protein